MWKTFTKLRNICSLIFSYWDIGFILGILVKFSPNLLRKTLLAEPPCTPLQPLWSCNCCHHFLRTESKLNLLSLSVKDRNTLHFMFPCCTKGLNKERAVFLIVWIAKAHSTRCIIPTSAMQSPCVRAALQTCGSVEGVCVLFVLKEFLNTPRV